MIEKMADKLFNKAFKNLAEKGMENPLIIISDKDGDSVINVINNNTFVQEDKAKKDFKFHQLIGYNTPINTYEGQWFMASPIIIKSLKETKQELQKENVSFLIKNENETNRYFIFVDYKIQKEISIDYLL